MALPDFNALRDLHNSANDLLHSPETQQVLVSQKQEKWLHEVSEVSLRMLDVCGVSKDVLLLVREHLLDLQFTLRRKRVCKQDISTEIAAYNLQKEAKERDIEMPEITEGNDRQICSIRCLTCRPQHCGGC
ncbi:hypothetical protein NC651_004843 [Populus alba x Populus x berolinensis]|nr:hypothetical protein NC651_004843 [Populus alba x Populus x berolinensis]